MSEWPDTCFETHRKRTYNVYIFYQCIYMYTYSSAAHLSGRHEHSECLEKKASLPGYGATLFTVVAPAGYLFPCGYRSSKDFSSFPFCLVTERVAFARRRKPQSLANERRRLLCDSRWLNFRHRRIVLRAK